MCPRGHVRDDLLPYTCFYDPCLGNKNFFAKRADWILHLKHEHSVNRWICEDCPVLPSDPTLPTFTTVQDWASHREIVHEERLEGSELRLEARMSERMVLDPVHCPLCPHAPYKMNLEEDDHIANHLQTFALKALPWHSDKRFNADDANLFPGSASSSKFSAQDVVIRKEKNPTSEPSYSTDEALVDLVDSWPVHNRYPEPYWSPRGITEALDQRYAVSSMTQCKWLRGF